jgi:hypothetical protein
MPPDRITTPTQELLGLVGTYQKVKPQMLLNRGLLFTTQCWLDTGKLGVVMGNKAEWPDEPPKIWVTYHHGKLCYIVGDGNHRIARACIEGENIDVFIQGIWDGTAPVYGFNMIVTKMRSELSI